MKPDAGKTLAEYALILALLVLLAIPGLAVLGDALNEGLEQNGDLSRADRLFSLLDGDPGATGSGPSPAETVSLLEGHSQINVVTDPVGHLDYILPTGETVGRMATSTNGERDVAVTRMAALAIRGLIESPGNEPVPDGIGDKIDRLARHMDRIADKESRYNAGEARDTGIILRDYARYNAIYSDIRGDLQDKGGYETLIAKLDRYSGVATHIARDNYFPDLPDNSPEALTAYIDRHAKTQKGYENLKSHPFYRDLLSHPRPVGEDPRMTVSIDLSPAVTYAASDRMAGHPPGNPAPSPDTSP